MNDRSLEELRDELKSLMLEQIESLQRRSFGLSHEHESKLEEERLKKNS